MKYRVWTPCWSDTHLCDWHSYRLVFKNKVKKPVTINWFHRFILCNNGNFDTAWKCLKISVRNNLFLHFTYFQNFWALIEQTIQPLLEPTGDRSVKTNCMSLVQAVSRPCSNVYAFTLWFLKHLAMLYTYDEKVCYLNCYQSPQCLTMKLIFALATVVSNQYLILNYTIKKNS